MHEPPMTPHERRNQLARRRGFSSYSQQRKYSRDIPSRSDLAALPLEAQLTRLRALDAVARARREGISLEDAAFHDVIDPQAVAFWAPSAVTRSGNRWNVTTADRLFRPMYIYTAGARQDIDVRGSKAASLVGRYQSAIGRYLETGDMSGLRAMAGVRVGGYPLETDADVIDQMARRDVLEFESIYRMVL